MAPTIATAFKEASIKEKYLSANPEATKIASFIISSDELQEEIRCSICQQETSPKDTTVRVNDMNYAGNENLLWCLSCDLVYHLSCITPEIKQISDAAAPFICKECIEYPNNAIAVDFASKGRNEESLVQRYKSIKMILTEDDQEDLDATAFFNESLHVAMHKGRLKPVELKRCFEEQRLEAQRLGKKLLEVCNQHAETQQQLLDAKQMLQHERNQLAEAKLKIHKLNEELQKKEEELSLYRINVRKTADESTFSEHPKKSSRIPGIIYADDFLTKADPFAKNPQPHASTKEASQPFGYSSTTRPSFCASNISFNQANITGTEIAIETLRKIDLTQLRTVLPVVKEFSGDPAQWLTFERSVNLVKEEGSYNDTFMKYIIRDKLKGLASKLVENLFTTHSCDAIMARLKSAFGNPQIVVDTARSQVSDIKLPKALTQAAVIEASTTLSGYIEACKLAGIQSHDRTLANAIHKQLDARYAEGYFAFFKNHYPVNTAEPRLDVLLEYLESIRDMLPIGTFTAIEKDTSKKNNSYQVSTISSQNNPITSNSISFSSRSSTKPSKSHTDTYTVRDINVAKFQGYYVDKVRAIKAHCLLCNRNGHYTVECRSFKKKTVEERQRFVDSKRLCPSCIITTDHKASNCSLKKQCGARVNGQRCEALHHISLHTKHNAKLPSNKVSNAPPKHDKQSSGDTNSSASTSNQSYQGFPVSNNEGGNQAIFATLKQNGFQVLTVSTTHSSEVLSSPRTIKLFRTYVTNGDKRAATFTVGDSAAEISLVKRSLVDALNISGPPCTLRIQWTDKSYKILTGIKVQIPIRGILPESKEYLISDCIAVDNFNLPPRSLNVDELKKQFPHLQSIPFESYEDVSPALLLGSSHAALVEAIAPIWEDGEGKPIGILTKLGYSIYGGSATPSDCQDVLNAISAELCDDDRITNEELSQQFEFANSLENIALKPIDAHLTADEKSAVDQAKAGLKHLSSGFIQMPLIWRLVDGQRPKLPDNFQMVLQRQLAQERKLKKNPELLEAFNNNFKSLIDDGYVRPATMDDMLSTGNVNYVPMSLVVNHNKRPIKTRNVYDASAKYKGTSLNANLLAGPNLLIDIIKPLMKMRENAIALTGDVKSMFHRIKIDPVDQNCQRILWRSNAQQPMQIFIQQAMLFGPTCSPFCSQFAKNWAADQFSKKYPETADSIKREVYMDDWLTSVSSEQEAIQRIKEGIEIFAFINMQLLSIQSNSPTVLAALPHTHLKKELIPLITGVAIECSAKILGVSWDIKTDEIIFELNENLLNDKYQSEGIKPTKRELCSLIARIYDVLGLLAHCIIRARIILQYAWRKQIDWDIQIEDEDAILWSAWLNDIKRSAKIRIPRRRTSLNSLTEAQQLELHTFCDAGKEAVAAVAYIVVVIDNKRETSFAMAKSKVAPLKLKSKQEITEMPRLEVLGALIGARLASHIRKLHEHLSFKQYFWCDSEVVLRWLWNTNLKLPRFAISPISEILELSEINEWKYVDSKQNVADLATKFQSHDFGNPNSSWFTGPKFISQNAEHWPSQHFSESKSKETILCVHNLLSLENDTAKDIENPSELFPKSLPPFDCALLSWKNPHTGQLQYSGIMNILINRKPSIYYNWSKLIRATARMLIIRNEIIIPLLKTKKWRSRIGKREIITKTNIREIIPVEYIHLAELFIIRFMQHQQWSTEIAALSKGQRIRNKELISLNVFLDNNQILRIKSRISLPYVEYPQKYAPIVPRPNEKDDLSDIMLRHYHNLYRHVCVESQMAEFRSKYWMTALREKLKSIGTRCNLCKFRRATNQPPLMADLPIYRVNRKLKPFECTGLDCCGPFLVKEKKKVSKVWVLLFTCTVTRFIHLELLEKIDTPSTLAAITAAYAAHGPIIRLISDNGTNFVGASNILHKEQETIIKELQKTSNSINQHFLNSLKDFRWDFIPVKAAWFGGFYERLIGELKRGMREELKSKQIDKLSFKIAMNETAHRLNCRPLTHLSVSHEDEEIITPHHLAKNRPGWPMLPSAHTLKDSHKPIELRTYYVEGQKIADRISRRFYKSYLSELTKRTKWHKKQPPLKIGDLVLIIDPNVTRTQWSKGIIENFVPSRDGIPRVAQIRTADSLKSRAIQHLAKIDINTT